MPDIYTILADQLRRRLTNRVNNEIELQEAVAKILPQSAKREHRFDEATRIDFYDPTSRVGIECKVKGSAQRIAAQLLTYEPHCPGGLILVLTKAREIPRVVFKLEIVVPFFA